MRNIIFRERFKSYFAAALLMLCAVGATSSATAAQEQPRAAQASASAKSAKASAVIDITGYWVSIVNEDWVWRMMTPVKGDLTGVPLNAEGRRVTLAWDPDKDKAEGNECKAYGAAGLMRIPERLHITWADDNTLQLETDAGMQKRLFHFDGSKWQGGEPQLQGDSAATWEKQVQHRAGPAFDGPAPGQGGNLHVVTSHMKPGYLQKNGIPYSGNALLDEHFTVIDVHGAAYLILVSSVQDPTYLRDSYVLSSQFKRESDGSKWDPTPCRPLWPMTLRIPLGANGNPNAGQ